MANSGPAASSAAVVAYMATLSGGAATTIVACQSMTTDVSNSPSVTSRRLVDQLVEVSPKLVLVDANSGCRQHGDLVTRDEGASAGADRPELGDGFTASGHDERLTCGHRIDDLRVVVAQHALWDGLRPDAGWMKE